MFKRSWAVHALDRSAIETGNLSITRSFYVFSSNNF